MSRVARSARVASRQRTESITASKTIEKAETGELYLVNVPNSAGTVAVTLPAAQEGAYFKFLWASDQVHNSSIFEIKTGGAAGTIQGVVQAIEVDATAAESAAEMDAGSATKVGFTANPDIHVGSWVECVSDGTNWIVNGCLYITAAGTEGDVIAWDA